LYLKYRIETELVKTIDSMSCESSNWACILKSEHSQVEKLCLAQVSMNLPQVSDRSQNLLQNIYS